MKLPVKRRASSFERRRAWAGLLFVSPFILGLILFFIKPLIDTVTYSFCTLQVNYETGFQTTFEGLDVYKRQAQGHCTSVPDKNTGAGVLPGGRVYRTEKEKAA